MGTKQRMGSVQKAHNAVNPFFWHTMMNALDSLNGQFMKDISEQIAELRREYYSNPLAEGAVDSDPIMQFKKWFAESVRIEQPDPEAMTLSTISALGQVSARVVLLRGIDERGFVFFTNYESRKSRDLIANPRAALTFYWGSLNRQVRIEGIIERVSRQESEEYFQTRPRGSQLGAWASPQSDEIADRPTLDRLLSETERRFEGQAIPCPPFWGGFRLKPLRIEFWQGRENRLHDRVLYEFLDDHWRISRLAP
jgi:pyridoxamine 5'-phosphate oxidase